MSTDDDRTMLTSESTRDPAAVPRADWPAQPPTTLPPGRKAGQRSSANLQWALLAIGAAVLIVLVAVAGFGLGFFLGRNRPAQRVATNAPAQAARAGLGACIRAQASGWSRRRAQTASRRRWPSGSDRRTRRSSFSNSRH